MQAPAIQVIIGSNRALPRELGINGTPGFIVGTDLVPGAIELKDLQNLVDQVRQEKG
jgi:protein-disulfide isomerase